MISGAYASTFIFSMLLLLATIVVNWAQVGSVWLPRAIAPDLTRLSFSQGFSKVASGFTSLPVLAGKALIAAAILVLLFVLTIPTIWHLQDAYLEQQWQQAAQLIGSFSLYTTMLLLGFSFFDVITQRKKFKEQVFLDHHEMQREFKESEGDPHLRAQRRALHQAISREEMIIQIKKAKVIIVERFEESSTQDGQGEV